MAPETDKILNEIAGSVVLLDEASADELKPIMDKLGLIEEEGLASRLGAFKLLLLDAATGQLGTPEKAVTRIQQEFTAIQKFWDELQRSEAAPEMVPEPVLEQELEPGPVPEIIMDEEPEDSRFEMDDAEDLPAAAPEIPVSPPAGPPPVVAPQFEEPSLDEDRELIAGFVQEAHEHLDSIEVNVLEWESRPEDKEVVNAIFRPFHTIKGMAGFLNLQDIQHLSHELENLLDAAREDKISFSTEISDVILKGVDALNQLLARVEARLAGKPPQAPPDPSGLLGRVHRLLTGGPAPAPAAETPRVGAVLIQSGSVEPAQVRDALQKQAAGDPRMLGQILVDEKKAPPEAVEKALVTQARKEQETTVAKLLKVDTTKMDMLFDMVGELVITHNMLMQNTALHELKDRRILADMGQLKRIISTLQSVALSMRMVPISSTFQKMRRVVYDVAQKAGKKINLHLIGENTEIDRNLVESLYDPLLHMVRNACDHGVEPPEKRLRAGKEETGNVTLEAYQKGGSIYIEIRDDGGGIDPARVRKKAIERGLIDEMDEMDDNAMIQLIFRPGFSTAENVTDISGRGVGMDVVKRAVARQGGRVEVHSEVGSGSQFIIRFPLTLAIVDGIVVMVGAERYILPTIHVKEALRIDKANYTKVAGRGETVLIRDKVYPLIRAHRFFNVSGARTDPWEGILILAENEFRDVAVLVDDIVGKQEVVIKNLGEEFQHVKGVSGGAILGDGRIGLILDVNQIEQTLG